MGNLYIGIIILCRIVQHLFNKKSSNEISGFGAFVRYGAYRQLLSAALGLALILASGSGFRCDVITVVVATVSGVMLFVSLVCSETALKSGTMALTSLFGTAGLLVPCIAGIYLFDQPMSAWQWVGVGLFLASAYFLISSSGRIHKKFTFRTLLLLVGVMLSDGTTMLMQQMFTQYVPDGDVSVFSFFSFGAIGVVLLIWSFFLSCGKGSKGAEEKRVASDEAAGRTEGPFSKRLMIYGAILSAVTFVVNQLATLATALVPPAVLFTFINGGSTIIATLVAALVFHERLTVRSMFGVMMGVAALVMIKVM